MSEQYDSDDIPMIHAFQIIIIRSAKIIASLLLLLLFVIGVSAFVCSWAIKVTQYDLSLDGLQNPVQIVVVADTHGKVFGKDNEPLYKKTAAQHPDAIILLGDLFPSDPEKDDLEYVIELTRRMQEISQVYFAMGNHEKTYTAKYGGDWISQLSETGAIVLVESWGDYSIAGNTVRLGSTLGHGFSFGRTEAAYKASPEYAVLTALENSPYPPILLAHMPDTAAFEDSKRNWHIDLVLSAHTHGGVIRIPGKGGLYVPMQGWWPRYDYGEIMLNEKMRMIITSGLSGHGKVPRIFSLPEIAVIDLYP